MTIRKYRRGFIVTNGEVASYPWIPKWYFKWLYPWAIRKAVKKVRQYGLG